MYKEKEDNVEVFFICYKKDEMELVETYYDEILNIHYWYFNAYKAYKLWKKKFKEIKSGNISKMLLTVAASRYLLYRLENNIYKSDKEYKIILKDLEKIEPQLKQIIEENKILINI